MVKKSRRGRSRQRGGEGYAGRPMSAGEGTEGRPMSAGEGTLGRPMAGGKRRRSQRRKGKKGGEGVIATAALPFGLFALQRYFKGSKTAKKGVSKVGRTFKRTFRSRL